MASRGDLRAVGILEDLVESAARTANGDSGALINFSSVTQIRAQLDVTAASGTSPTLDVVVEDTLDGTNWNAVATFTQRTGTGREVIDITTLFADRLRIRWTVGGTSPSFTFSVRAYSEQ